MSISEIHKKVSIAITVCNEIVELKRLIELLLANISANFEIQILVDKDNVTTEVKDYISELMNITSDIYVHEYPMNNDFATFKNYLNSCCNGEYIFQIDADEYPHNDLIKILINILDANPNIEMYQIPRINTVENISNEYINQMGWSVNKRGWINFPDSQNRLYKNKDCIRWSGKVHEVIIGYNSFTSLPEREEYCLYHPKSFEKQKKQNELYANIMKK